MSCTAENKSNSKHYNLIKALETDPRPSKAARECKRRVRARIRLELHFRKTPSGTSQSTHRFLCREDEYLEETRKLSWNKTLLTKSRSSNREDVGDMKRCVSIHLVFMSIFNMCIKIMSGNAEIWRVFRLGWGGKVDVIYVLFIQLYMKFTAPGLMLHI